MSAIASPAVNSARPMTDAQLDQLSINTIRTLSIDAVQQAKSGHPGTPMALAPLVYTLWNRVMRFDPQDPIWPNRDRFVLSNGHASMLLWSLLHLTGTRAVNADYERLGQPAVSLDDIRHFRQLGSKAPGHPEYHLVSGVEATTGPLGQGVATSVGMAIAEAWLANRYNRPGFEVFGYNIYAVCGDGCMMEGVGSEAASLAGHLALDNLCWIYDNNHITIEGNTRITFTEDIAARFLGYGWNVLRVGDANDIGLIEHALDVFHKTKDRPTFIILDSHIGYGSPHKQDTAAAHGEPLGEDEVRLTKRDYGWPEDAKFLVPDAVRAHFAAGIGARGAQARARWTELFAAYRSKYSELATEIDLMQRRELPAGWDRGLPVFPADPKGIAGRDASGKVLNVLAQNIPWLLGGSADLGSSNKTLLTFEGAGDFEPGTPGGRNLHFGIREHAMAAAVNGLSLSKLRAFGATFFIFSDYARPAIRLSAIMELPTIFVFTHDAMGDGEDGPTHQPVEQLASFRAEPGLVVLRPADANEVVEAYRYIMQLKHQPAVLALSRQPLPTLDRSRYAPASGVARGAYVLADPPGGKPDVILIASGSEVSLCVGAH
jgi:transketolase